MNKSLQMKVYHHLRKTNPKLAKSKFGRSVIMKEAVYCVNYHYNYTEVVFVFVSVYTLTALDAIKGLADLMTEPMHTLSSDELSKIVNKARYL